MNGACRENPNLRAGKGTKRHFRTDRTTFGVSVLSSKDECYCQGGCNCIERSESKLRQNIRYKASTSPTQQRNITHIVPYRLDS